MEDIEESYILCEIMKIVRNSVQKINFKILYSNIMYV